MRRHTLALAAGLCGLALMAAPAEARKIEIDDDPSKGEAKAPLVLIEFADYQ